MRVYIVDAHALITLPEVVQPSTLGEVFGVMSALVHTSELLITKSVIEVLRRLAPNEPSCIWAGTIMELRRHVKVDYSWQMLAQEAAQDAGYDDGLDDVLAERSSAVVEVAGLVLLEVDKGNEPAVVTEDRADKPLRPALERKHSRGGCGRA